MARPSAIYVRMPNWIGDLCMSLPCLDALIETQLPVIVCARPWARDILSATPVDGFIEMSGSWPADARRVRRHHRHLSERVVGLLLPDSLSSALVFRLAGIPATGYRDDGRSLLLKWPVNKPEQDLHAVESWYHLTQQALLTWRLAESAHPAPDHLKLRLDLSHEKRAHDALRQAGIHAGNFVLIAPTAVGLHHGQNKVWPYFDPLTRHLQDKGHAVVMCPPPAERAQARANAPHAVCLPALDLGSFAALTRLASVVVCNDSGVSHIAAATSARQITLFGVTEIGRTGPWSPRASCLGELGRWPTLSCVMDTLEPMLSTPSHGYEA